MCRPKLRGKLGVVILESVVSSITGSSAGRGDNFGWGITLAVVVGEAVAVVVGNHGLMGALGKAPNYVVLDESLFRCVL